MEKPLEPTMPEDMRACASHFPLILRKQLNINFNRVPANTPGTAWTRSRMEPPCKFQILQEPYGDPFNLV